MDITYRTDLIPDVNEVISVYQSSGIKRPVADPERIKKMYDHANLVATAWHKDKLVGVARSLTDFCYCCYLSDLAVHNEYQHLGIGKKLIAITKDKIGDQTSLILVSAPTAVPFYEKIGMEQIEHSFIIKRLS